MPRPPDPACNLRLLHLSEAQFQSLLSQTAATLASEQPLNRPGVTGSDAVFPARGHFSLLRNGNVWLGQDPSRGRHPLLPLDPRKLVGQPLAHPALGRPNRVALPRAFCQ